MKKQLLRIFTLVLVFALVFTLPMCAMKYVMGDMNGDGIVNTDDAIYLLRHVLTPDKYPLACSHALTRYEAKEATCEESGHNAYEECSKCGYTTYQEIEALNHKDAKEELPIGSVIVVDEDYQYRPEGWTALDQVNASADRPKMQNTPLTVVTDDWWGNFNYRAFNISMKGNNGTATAEDAAHFKIYIPKK